jgi:hypothetical protein
MKLDLHNITNQYQDVRLISLSSWRQAHEIVPRDRNGPYVILEEGYDPEDPKMIAEDFVLGRSGKWLSLGHFYRMPIPERRAEFLFGTVAEVIELMSNLPSKAEFLRPAGKETEASTTPAPSDGMMEAFQAGRTKQSGASH